MMMIMTSTKQLQMVGLPCRGVARRTVPNRGATSGLAKTILRGTVKGGRRQGRQRKRWEDNIKKWTGLEFGKSQRAVENREKWRKLVAKYLWCPNDPHG